MLVMTSPPNNRDIQSGNARLRHLRARLDADLGRIRELIDQIVEEAERQAAADGFPLIPDDVSENDDDA